MSFSHKYRETKRYELASLARELKKKKNSFDWRT